MRAPTDAERAASHRLVQAMEWHDADGNVADDDTVAAEWDMIKSRTDLASHGGMAYEAIATLALPDTEIDRIVADKLAEMEAFLKGREPFARFDDFPADAQLGLLSMAWGMGPAFRFPKFQSFVQNGDWRSAADECRFQPDQGAISRRNDRDQILFRNAAAVVENGDDPATLVWPTEN